MTGHFPPPLPPGRRLVLPGRGETFVRELAGPPGAATVLLLHGWIATADLNWWTSYAELGRHFRVVALDHRGHGRGLRSSRRFRLADCADDAGALIEQLGTGPVIAVGYSMGGPIAQLLWHRHPRALRGLVLCATSREFPFATRERLLVGAVGYGIGLTPPWVRRRLLRSALSRGEVRRGEFSDWLLSELRPHDIRAVVAAGKELARFDSRPWLGGVDVPSAVIATLHDELVPLERQRQLAAAISGATLREIDGDHLVCSRRPELFVPALVAACEDVADSGERDQIA